MERLYLFNLNISGGPLDPSNTDLQMASRITEAHPDVLFSRYEGQEWIRYSRHSTSLQAATLTAMRELHSFLPHAQLLGVVERAPSSEAFFA